LTRQGATPKVMGYFYKAVCQAILLYGCETWVVTHKIHKALESFHHRVARQISNLRIRLIRIPVIRFILLLTLLSQQPVYYHWKNMYYEDGATCWPGHMTNQFYNKVNNYNEVLVLPNTFIGGHIVTNKQVF
jgi:hypothetical protein